MAERRRGLGRGIGALIPSSQKEVKESPIDVFFGGNGEERTPGKPKGQDVKVDAMGAGVNSSGADDGNQQKTATTNAATDSAKAKGGKSATKKSGATSNSSKKSAKNATSKTAAASKSKTPKSVNKGAAKGKGTSKEGAGDALAASTGSAGVTDSVNEVRGASDVTTSFGENADRSAVIRDGESTYVDESSASLSANTTEGSAVGNSGVSAVDTSVPAAGSEESREVVTNSGGGQDNEREQGDDRSDTRELPGARDLTDAQGSEPQLSDQGDGESTRGENEEADSRVSEAGTSDVSASVGDADAGDSNARGTAGVVVKRRSGTEPFDQDGAVSFSEEVASVSVSSSELTGESGSYVSRETVGTEDVGTQGSGSAGDSAANAGESVGPADDGGRVGEAEGRNDWQRGQSAADSRVDAAGETAADVVEQAEFLPADAESVSVSDVGEGRQEDDLVVEDRPNEADISRSALAGDGVSVDAVESGAESSESDASQESWDDGLVEVPGATFAELPLDYIIPNTRQPRNVFDEEELSELAASIREVGVLQPVIVRPLDEPIPDKPQARYELIMGERRWRASVLADEETVPAIVRRTQDEDLLRDALLENLHRTQLNALEEAAAYQQLLEDFQCTQEELSRRIARSRPQISNTLRLLKLPPLVQRRVAAGVLSAGHARALLGLSDPGAMERIAQKIVAEGLSVRQVEELVALGDETAAPAPARRRAKRYAPELGELATRLTDRFDTRVKVEMGARRGSIKIDFASIDDLNRILGVLTPGEEGVDVDE